MAQGNDKPQLLGIARRRAFETYLRYGHRPEPAGLSGQESKALTPSKKPPSKPTRFYVWRAAGDDRVRATHALRDGQVFAWNEPPTGGHPGSEPNCRCWAEPYFGDPDVPDALLPMQHDHRVATTPTQPWSSIESLLRPDGSLAESIVSLRDGTDIRSRFWGSLIARTVTLASGGQIRIDSEGTRQQVYLGDDTVPLFRSAWTPSGPRVTHAQRRVAFMGDLDTLVEPDFGGTRIDPIRNPNPSVLSPNPMLDLFAPDGGLDLLGAAFLALHSAQQAAPTSQGMAEDERSVISFRAWSTNGERGAVPLLVDALTEEQLRRSCKYLPDAQRWTDEAAQLLSRERWTMSPQTWGTKVHLAVKNMVEAQRKLSPEADKVLRAELSMTIDKRTVSYGLRGSTRLDILENRMKDLGAVCVYDSRRVSAA